MDWTSMLTSMQNILVFCFLLIYLFPKSYFPKTTTNEIKEQQKSTANPSNSLLASLIGLRRTQDGLIQIDESVLTQLIKTYETNRIEWLSTQRDLEKCTKKNEKLEQRNIELNTNLKPVRQHYGKEVKRGQEIKQEIKSIQQMKNSIKDFVKSQSNSESSDESIVRLMEYLQRLDTTDDTTNESLDGYELDKSEELN